MFNKNLKRIRLENNLTQKEVADFLHISPQSISKWENGESTTSIDFLPMLAHPAVPTPPWNSAASSEMISP